MGCMIMPISPCPAPSMHLEWKGQSGLLGRISVDSCAIAASRRGVEAGTKIAY
jgi:hypothetical protein